MGERQGSRSHLLAQVSQLPPAPSRFPFCCSEPLGSGCSGSRRAWGVPVLHPGLEEEAEHDQKTAAARAWDAPPITGRTPAPNTPKTWDTQTRPTLMPLLAGRSQQAAMVEAGGLHSSESRKPSKVWS